MVTRGRRRTTHADAKSLMSDMSLIPVLGTRGTAVLVTPHTRQAKVGANFMVPTLLAPCLESTLEFLRIPAKHFPQTVFPSWLWPPNI